MSLIDLVKRIPAQTAAINKLTSRTISTTDASTDWDEFRKSLWGQRKNLFEKEAERFARDKVDPIEPVHILPDPPPETRAVITPPVAPYDWETFSNKILVRSEYIKAEKAAVLANTPVRRIFVVGGQPGIGKSTFLLWLLMRRLALELPTVLQVHSSYAILFHGGGVSELTNLENVGAYLPLQFSTEEISSRIWVLVDSNPNLLEPASIFKHASPFFVVDAVSPRSNHLEWLKKTGTEAFYMKPWSVSELLQVRSYLAGGSCTERQLLYLHKEFGATLRFLALYAHVPHEYEEILDGIILRVDISSLPHLLRDPGSSDLSTWLVKIQPMPTNRRVALRTFASRRVFDMLWEKHIYSRVDIMSNFHDLFVSSRFTATSAGWVFERRMHQLLTRKQTIVLFPVRGKHSGKNVVYDNYAASKARKNPTNLELKKPVEHELVEDSRLRVDRYYRPKSSTFPSIDSLRLIHPPGEAPILLMFQITRNRREHDAKLKGLRKIENMGFPNDTRRYYVAVTPESIRPKIKVPEEYFEERQGRKPKEEQEEVPQDVEMDEDPVEELDEESDEESSEESDEEMDDVQARLDGEVAEREAKVVPDVDFWVYHYPVPMDQLFRD